MKQVEKEINSHIEHKLPQCCFISPKCLNFLSQCKQLNGSSSVWVLSCSFKSLPSANFLSHFVQLNGSSPKWLLLCCFNSSNSENLLSSPERFCTMSSFMFLQIMRKWEFLDTLWTAIWLFSRTMRFCVHWCNQCISERGNFGCCSFKNVTQPLMFICQTWFEKCQK